MFTPSHTYAVYTKANTWLIFSDILASLTDFDEAGAKSHPSMV